MNKRNNKKYKFEDLFEGFDRLLETDYNLKDLTIPPTEWHREKIMFYLERVSSLLQLNRPNFLTTQDKHNILARNLRKMGFISINLKSSFAPTHLGYLNEHFSASFKYNEINKSELLSKNIEKHLQSVKLLSSAEKTLKLEIDEFGTNFRIQTITGQGKKIESLFKNLFSDIKKSKEVNNVAVERNIVECIIVIYAILLDEMERMSSAKERQVFQQEKIRFDGSDREIYQTELKIIADYKKPKIRLYPVIVDLETVLEDDEVNEKDLIDE